MSHFVGDSRNLINKQASLHFVKNLLLYNSRNIYCFELLQCLVLTCFFGARVSCFKIRLSRAVSTVLEGSCALRVSDPDLYILTDEGEFVSQTVTGFIEVPLNTGAGIACRATDYKNNGDQKQWSLCFSWFNSPRIWPEHSYSFAWTLKEAFWIKDDRE